MITLEDGARTELDAYFADKEKSAVRVYLAPGGCSGPRLALALDEAGDDDTSCEANGYTFVVNKNLLESITSATISMTEMGFMVTPETPLPNAGGGCGGCGSSSSCCS